MELKISSESYSFELVASHVVRLEKWLDAPPARLVARFNETLEASTLIFCWGETDNHVLSRNGRA